MRVTHLVRILGLTLLATAPVAAQQRIEVVGRILDGTSDEPIADAVVRLTDNGPMAVSDSTGRFVLRGVGPGTHPWQISRIGYATWNEDVAAEAEDEFTIRLLPQPEVLEGLVVLADRFRDRREA
ncbi:MAG TPA: carboxypeptidase regulatory-like domain-containing protein, partial [Longimicrobiaceae bacterium]|nr:carboxypeptidase regulatory-like domain-containing protein [Longimicrobiaceae bacterium]